MKKIIEKVFGKILGIKYHAIVVDYMGHDSLSAQVYMTEADAKAAAKEMQEGRNQYELHVISFRSRRRLIPETINRNHVSYAKD